MFNSTFFWNIVLGSSVTAYRLRTAPVTNLTLLESTLPSLHSGMNTETVTSGHGPCRPYSSKRRPRGVNLKERGVSKSNSEQETLETFQGRLADGEARNTKDTMLITYAHDFAVDQMCGADLLS